MKRIFTYILFLVSFLSFGSKLSFTTDSTNYLIGEQANFTLNYEGDDVTWHGFNEGDTLTKDLEILEISKIDTLGKGLYKQTFKITSWDSGYFVVPPIQIGDKQSAPTLLRFNTVQLDPNSEFKAIKEQMDTPFIFDEIKELVLWAILILVLLVVAFFVGRHFYKKHKNKPQAEPILPERPIMEILWERFNSLEESRIWEKGEEKDFQTELSLILRKFLEYKFNVKALEETTGNISKQLNAIGLDRVMKDQINHILNFSDMVKFAKQKGVYTQHENALGILKKLLESNSDESVNG